MVLLYGVAGDGPIELVMNQLEELQIPFVLLNQRHFCEFDMSISHTANGIDGYITIANEAYDLNDFTGIYNRALDFSALPEARALPINSDAYQHYSFAFTLLNDWIETCNCRVLNKASAMSSNSSKPYQLVLIQPFFDVPGTLISNSPETVMNFQQDYGEVIYKSASSVRSVVRSMQAGENAALKNIRFCPTLFQEKLVGFNYRVHVVGEQIFALKILSDSIDYRYSKREGNDTHLIAVDLDQSIQQRCLSLSKELNLQLAGIDLFETEDGKWLCFEVNPSPGFSYFENESQQPIAKAIASYLAGSSS